MLNALLLWSSFYWSRFTGRQRRWGQPISLAIEPTTACNLKCPECPSGLRSFSRATGNLKKDLFTETIDQVSTHLINLTFYFQGEPFIHPEFLDMVTYANERGIYTTTSTNGHFLSEAICDKIIDSGLDRLIISIDGSTQEVYESYRKSGDLAQVIDGTSRLISTRQRRRRIHPYIIFQCLVVKPNEHQLADIRSLADQLGIDEVKFKTAQLYDYVDGHELMPENERYSRYKKNEKGQFELAHDLVNACWKMWHSAVITWDGKLVPCCFDKDAQHILGDLRTSSMSEIWIGDKAQKFAERLSEGRAEIDICANCSEGCKVWG